AAGGRAARAKTVAVRAGAAAARGGAGAVGAAVISRTGSFAGGVVPRGVFAAAAQGVRGEGQEGEQRRGSQAEERWGDHGALGRRANEGFASALGARGLRDGERGGDVLRVC